MLQLGWGPLTTLADLGLVKPASSDSTITLLAFVEVNLDLASSSGIAPDQDLETLLQTHRHPPHHSTYLHFHILVNYQLQQDSDC